MATWADIINEAFIDLAVIQPGEVIPAAGTMQTDAFLRLQQMIASLSTEGATVQNEVLQSFNLLPFTPNYLLGVGGTWGTSARPQRVVAWSAFSGNFRSGGMPLSFTEFYDQAKDTNGSTATIPTVLAADTAYPLLNVQVFPTPGQAPGTVQVKYWVPIGAPVSVDDVVNLPPGFEDMLHFNLAVRLYSQYARAGGIPPELAANAQNTKAVIIAQNSTGVPVQGTTPSE